MLTDTAATVDGRGILLAGHWLSVSDLAKDHRVSKQAVSKNIERWTSAGQTITTRRQGKALLVNVAEYDAARAEAGDGVHVLTEERKRDGPVDPADPILAKEQARKAGYDADLKFIELEKQRGRLVEVEALDQAGADCGHIIGRAIDQIINRAEEIGIAYVKDGLQGARTVAKDVARQVKKRAAEELAKLPMLTAAPDTAPDDVENDGSI